MPHGLFLVEFTVEVSSAASTSRYSGGVIRSIVGLSIGTIVRTRFIREFLGISLDHRVSMNGHDQCNDEEQTNQ